VDHALAVLEMFGPQTPDLGVVDVSRGLGVPGPTAYRLLSTLESRGFLKQHPTTRRYSLGLKLFEIGARISTGLGLVDIARPHLVELVRRTEESAYLAIWDRGESLSIDKVDSPLQLYLRSTVGTRRPVNGASTGKVLLAYQPPEVVEEVLANLKAHTDQSITDPAYMRAELEQVRRQGYAVNRGEFHPQASGIAAPVWNRHEEMIASIGLGIPTSRMSEERLPELLSVLFETTYAVSTQLGRSGSQPDRPEPRTLVGGRRR
jgi:DNA-binding IclR family transcriptional regulator